ncbi:MAG: DMT family transporter [Tardiphaga sp.]|nr:DMT family transporter [Tardiphaga sp.]
MSAPSVSTATGGRPLTLGAIVLMVMLCVSWGFNQIAIKIVLQEIPPYLQAMLRSSGALVVILCIAAIRGTRLFERDGTLWPGLICGVLFGVEFLLIFYGLQFTSASRAAVFLYTAPFFVAIGSYQFLGERLRLLQWIGLAVSFAGVAFAIGVPQPDVDAAVLTGDLMIVVGAILWAMTTLTVKGTTLIRCPPEKALGYQVAMSIPILGTAALFAGETIPRLPGTLTLALMAWQAIWVVGMTFMIWFSLVKVYSASKLSAFTFLTPLVGVAGGYFILHDPLTPTFGVAAVLVIVGLYLVNKPVPRVA